MIAPEKKSEEKTVAIRFKISFFSSKNIRHISSLDNNVIAVHLIKFSGAISARGIFNWSGTWYVQGPKQSL